MIGHRGRTRWLSQVLKGKYVSRLLARWTWQDGITRPLGSDVS